MAYEEWSNPYPFTDTIWFFVSIAYHVVIYSVLAGLLSLIFDEGFGNWLFYLFLISFAISIAGAVIFIYYAWKNGNHYRLIMSKREDIGSLKFYFASRYVLVTGFFSAVFVIAYFISFNLNF